MILGASFDSLLPLRSRPKKDKQRANHFEIASVSCIHSSHVSVASHPSFKEIRQQVQASFSRLRGCFLTLLCQRVEVAAACIQHSRLDQLIEGIEHQQPLFRLVPASLEQYM